jgi:acyl carrier protein
MSGSTAQDDGHLLEELHQLVAGVLDLDPADVPVDMPLAETLGVDSVMVMQIMVMLQKRYRVEFQDVDLVRLQSASLIDMRAILREKLNGRDDHAAPLRKDA